MAMMKPRTLLGRGEKEPKVTPIDGLPVVNYHLPVAVTLVATIVLVLLVGFLTILAFANSYNAWNASGAAAGGATPAAFLFCGAFGLVGIVLTGYFMWAVVRGVRDLLTPIHFTRGTLADKRAVAGRMAGDWIGVSPSYAGPDLAMASEVTDEQAAASVDRTKIVQPRMAPGASPAAVPGKRGGYLSRERISSQQAETARSLGAPGPRAVFRVDPGAYAQLQPGEEVLVAHSRFLEHIYYVAHLRDGRWVSFRNKALI